MTKVKVFEKVKDQLVKVIYQMKGLAKKHMWNMKALAPTNQKLRLGLKFSKRSNSKVKNQRVNVMVSNERSRQKEYTCKIWKP
jgi:hypothetical protein